VPKAFWDWLSVILFIGMVGALGFEALTASQELPSKQDSYRADSTKHNTESNAAIEESHSSEQANKRKEKQAKAAEHAIEFLNIKISDALIAIFTIVLAYKTAGLFNETARLRSAADQQASDMKASIAAAVRSADISERALTELEAPFTAIKIIDTGLIRKTTETGHDFAILKFSITNDGRTPARLVELVDKTIFVPVGAGQPPPINLDYRSRNTMPYGVISPPGSESQPFTQNLILNHMNELAADTLILKSKAFFFYGFVRYETIFKQTYRMGFCYMFDLYGERWILTGEDNYNYLTKEG
jgi:hypothetical protein